ncbi:MAG: LexA family transcriptional regulator [Deltaproteobacteria bacterium]|nr:LexA family transcriptional regulator [Deltaproteobacteria bacterium]
MIKLGKIIREIRRRKGLSQGDLARNAAISLSYMNCIEQDNDIADNVGMATMERVAEALGTDLSFLFAMAAQEGEKPGAVTGVPVIGLVNTKRLHGPLKFDKAGLFKGKPLDYLSNTSRPDDPCCYAVVVKDRAMDPIGEGWRLVVTPSTPVDNHDLVVADTGKTLIFRRVQFDNNIIVLTALNTAFGAQVFNKKSLFFLHKVWSLMAP